MVAAFSAALFAICFYHKCKFNTYSKTCLVVATWLALEILADYISISFSLTVTPFEAVRYYFALAFASLAMSATTSINGLYPSSVRNTFTVITFICVSMAFWRWGVQTRWDTGGAEFYDLYGTFIDSAFVCSIAGLDGLLIVVGFYSALGVNNNSVYESSSKR